jgi:hypothetical protein
MLLFLSYLNIRLIMTGRKTGIQGGLFPHFASGKDKNESMKMWE